MTFITFMTHGNVIFDIIESHALNIAHVWSFKHFLFVYLQDVQGVHKMCARCTKDVCKMCARCLKKSEEHCRILREKNYMHALSM